MVSPSEGHKEEFLQFKKIINDFLIRRVEGKLSANDFDDNKSEYIRMHLGEFMCSLSLTEIMRIQVYFTDSLVFHTTSAIGKAVLYCPPTSPEQRADENDTQMPLPISSETSPQLTEIVGQTNLEVQTPIETISVLPSPVPTREQHDLQTISTIETPTQMAEMFGFSQSNIEESVTFNMATQNQSRKNIPMTQSTPISVPILANESCTPLDPKMTYSCQDNPYIADIISQINISPIGVTNANFSTKPGTSSAQNIQSTAVSVQKAKNIRNYTASSTPNTARRRLQVNKPILQQPKIMKKKQSFENLCCFTHRQRTDDETREAHKSFLYFEQMPGKTLINRIIKSNAAQEGNCSRIPMEKITNLSNIIRAHASQSHSSIELPNQICLRSILRSPCTPQGNSPASELQLFTPHRDDVSSIQLHNISSIPMRSLLHQQPLLTIPERDSTVPNPQSLPPHDTSIDIPRLPENSSAMPMDIGHDGDHGSNSMLPRVLHEDIEMIESEHDVSIPQLQPSTSIIPPHMISPPNFPRAIPEESDAADIVPISIIDESAQRDYGLWPNTAGQNVENARTSWFEILRPRDNNIEYPLDNGERRKRKTKKRKRERTNAERNVQPRLDLPLPEIPDYSNSNHFQSMAAFPENFSEQTTQTPFLDSRDSTELRNYIELIKEAGRDPVSWKCERFDPYIFSEDDDFVMYTYLFKRIIKDQYIKMDTLFEKGTRKLDVAKGFKFILELEKMGLITIDATDMRIMGFKLNTGVLFL